MQPYRDDVRLLSLFHYVLAGLSGLCACVPLLYIGLGALFASGAAFQNDDHPPPPMMGFVFIGFGLFVLVLLVAWIVLLVLAGRFLARRRHWLYCMVVAGLSCTSFPLGTALGVFTLVVLSRPEVRAQFGVPVPTTMPPTGGA